MTDYLTADEAQRWTGAPTDELIGEVESTITAVSAMIDHYCQRTFGTSSSESRDFAATNTALIRFGPFNDLVSVSAVATDDGTGTFGTTVTDYVLEPHNTAGPETKPYNGIRRVSGEWPMADSLDVRQARVRVTGTWGWPSVPAPVKAACRMQVARVFKRNESPLGVAGFGEFGVVRVPSQLDPDVRQMLAPYRILAGFA